MVSPFNRSSVDHATVGNVLLDGAIRWLARFDGSYERFCQRPGQSIDHIEPEWTIDLCFKAPKVIGDAFRLDDLDTGGTPLSLDYLGPDFAGSVKEAGKYASVSRLEFTTDGKNQVRALLIYGNSWPPLPAVLNIDDPLHPTMKSLPASYLSPANEWYSWQPDPRRNQNIKVLMTLAPSNYPIGFKDTLTGRDIPVTWTNTKYKMIYTNMGHGEKMLTSPEQNRFFETRCCGLEAASSSYDAIGQGHDPNQYVPYGWSDFLGRSVSRSRA